MQEWLRRSFHNGTTVTQVKTRVLASPALGSAEVIHASHVDYVGDWVVSRHNQSMHTHVCLVRVFRSMTSRVCLHSPSAHAVVRSRLHYASAVQGPCHTCTDKGVGVGACV